VVRIILVTGAGGVPRRRNLYAAIALQLRRLRTYWISQIIINDLKILNDHLTNILANYHGDIAHRCGNKGATTTVRIRWEYCLANFKTAAFNHSATPPFFIVP
jgi:hypothetical protein